MTAPAGREQKSREISTTAFTFDDKNPRYEVGEPLGQGGMSQVVRVFDRARGEHVALKVLSKAEPALALGTEFRYIASLHHPGVVSVYDFGVTADGQPFFTMELLGEGDLLDVASRASLAATLRTVREVFRTLEFVHARGIVHADLKPTNILIGKTRDGEHYPKLLDFGVAWQTVDQQTGGTPQYMAPELFMRGPRDHRVDLYAMGVVLHEVLTGQLPFDEPTILALAQRHLSAPVPDPRDLNPALPGELAELNLRLLEKKPDDRFQHAREVVRAIDAYLGKIDGPPPSRAEPYVVAEPEVRIAGGSRFVGHQAELERLLARALMLEHESGALFVVAGESGAGKTRLLTELRVGVQLMGIGCLHVDLGACQAGDEVIDAIGAALAAAGAGAAARVGATMAPDSALGADPLILEGERLAGTAIALGGRLPLVLGIEGIDDLSEDAGKALRAFAMGARGGAVMVVATTRTNEGGAAGELAGIDGAQRIELRRVSKEACGEILRSLLGEMDGADDIVEHVYSESGGNPGAIERVVHGLVASDAIVLRGNSWVVSPELGGELPVLGAERGLRAIAKALVGGLGKRELEVARAGASIGERFDGELVVALSGNSGVHDTLRELVASQVLEPADEPAEHSWARFRFRQRAVREVLLEATPQELAREHSRRIVELLEKRKADGSPYDPEPLARHLLALGDGMRAAEAAAAAMSERGRPSAELVQVLRRALTAMSDAPEDSARWCELAKTLADIDRRQGREDEAIAGYRRIAERAPPSSAQLRVAAQCELGNLQLSRGEEDGEVVLRGALNDASALGDADLVGRAAYTLADRWVLAGRYAEASVLVSEALAVSEETGDRLLRAQTLKLCATLNWLGGSLEEAARYASAAVDEYSAIGSSQGMAASLGALANVLYSRGEKDAARDAYSQALRHAHEAGWLTGICKLENGLAVIAYHSDDWDSACEHFDASSSIALRTGDPICQLAPMYSMGFVAAKRGDALAARTHYKRALELARKAKYGKGEAAALGNLGELALDLGALDEAGANLSESRDIAERIGATSTMIETERRLLELELARHMAPLAIVEKAQELHLRAEQESVRLELPQIRRVAGIALARAREPERAKIELDAAREGFEELGSRYEAARTVRIMAELAATGLLHDDRMERRLRDACRVFRKLRAQPELDAARRIRERLGMPSSTHSLRRLDEAPARDSWDDTESPASRDLPIHAAPARSAPTEALEPASDSPLRSPSHVPPSRATQPSQVPDSSGGPPSSGAQVSHHDAPTQLAPGVSLVDVSRELSEILELDQLLARVIDAAIVTSGAERGFVIVCDGSGQPTLRVSRGLGGVSLDEDLEMSRSAVGRAIATRQRIEWQTDAPPRTDGLGDSVTLLGLQAVAALPLINRGQLRGVLYLDTRNPRSDLTGASIAPLEALAAQAAVAIHNAQLFEELGRKNELMASAINQLRHPLDALQRCAERASQQAAGTPSEHLTETVRSHAKRLSVMVTRLLELATAEPAHVSGSEVSVQVSDLVDAAVLQVQPLADIAEIPIALDVPWGLPTILGHREQLIQVIVSMLGTALRCSAAAHGVALRASTVEPPSRDSDPFFPPSDEELYGREDVEIEVSYAASAEEMGGLDALGLAITREIVEHHGGSWTTTTDKNPHRLVAVFPALVPGEGRASVF